MAINDDKTYVLTGSQIKDIVNNIKTAQSSLADVDDNYPTSTPSGVALWLLPPGVYRAPNGKKVYVSISRAITVNDNDGCIFIVFRENASSTYTTILYGGAESNRGYRGPKVAIVSTGSGSTYSDGYIVSSDSLTGSLGRNAGGSYVGYNYQVPNTSLVAQALNTNSISTSAPTSTTQAAKGHVMAVYDPNDPTVGHLYMCTDSNYVQNVWTWIQLL